MTSSSRRRFLHGLGVSAVGAAALSANGLFARPAFADGPSAPPDVANADLKFVFFFNSGGWDPLTVFAPMFERDEIEMGDGDEPITIGGLELVHSVERPAVRAFFEQHHERTAVLNGVSVRSLSHEVCRSICLTGNSSGREPEWSAVLNSVRGLEPGGLQEGLSAVEALTSGGSRCATISPSVSWDTHSDNVEQSALFETLFTDLAKLMQRLADTPGEHAATLADETVLVVMSEMGRTPRFNAFDGRDHWPYTSVMLLGPGIIGSRMVGGFDDRYHGRRIDPASGEVDDGGVILTAGAVGATLIELGGADPATFLPGATSIRGLLL